MGNPSPTSRRSWPSGPAYDAVSLTLSDSVDLVQHCNALYIGVTGDVKLTTWAGNDVTFKAVPVGILPVGATRVWSTGTTATNIIALYNGG